MYKIKNYFSKPLWIRIFSLLSLSLIVGALYQNCAPEDSDSYPEDIPNCTNGAKNPPDCNRFGPCIHTYKKDPTKEETTTTPIENGKTLVLTENNGCTQKTLSCKDNVITPSEEDLCKCVDPITHDGLVENQTVQHLSTESNKTNCTTSYTCKNSKLETKQTCPANNNPACVLRWKPRVVALNDKPIGLIEVSSDSVAAKYSCIKTGTAAAEASITVASRAGSFTLAPATTATQPTTCTIQLTDTTAGQASALTGSCTTSENDSLIIKPSCIVSGFPINASTSGLIANLKPAIDLTITDLNAKVAKINFDCGGSNQGTIAGQGTYKGLMNFQPTTTTNCSFSLNTTYDSQPIACTDAAGTKASWELKLATSTDPSTTCRWSWNPATVNAGGSATGTVEVTSSDNSVTAFYSCNSLNSIWTPITLNTDKKGSFTKTNIIPTPDCAVKIKDAKGERACDPAPTPLSVTGTAACPKYYKLAGAKAETERICVADYDNYECKYTKDNTDYPGYNAEITPPNEAQYVRNAYCLILNRDPGNPARQPFLSSESELQPAGGDLSGLHYYTELMQPVQANPPPGLSLESLIKNFLENPKFLATLKESDTDQVLAERLASALLFKATTETLGANIMKAVTDASGDCNADPKVTVPTSLTNQNLKNKYCKFLHAAHTLTKDNTFEYYTANSSTPKWNYSTAPTPLTGILATSLQITDPTKRGTLRDMNSSASNLYRIFYGREVSTPLTNTGYKTGVVGQSVAKLTKYYSDRTKPLDIYDVIINLYLSKESLDKIGSAPKTTLKGITLGTNKLDEAQIHLLVTDLYNRFLGRDPMTTETGKNEVGCFDNDSSTPCGQDHWETEFKKATTAEEQLKNWPAIILNFLKASKQNEKPEIETTHPDLFPRPAT